MPDPVDKELQPSDTQAAPLAPTNFERSGDSDEDQIKESEEKDSGGKTQSQELNEKDESRFADLEEVNTGASEAQTISRATSGPKDPPKKSWHRKLNPLRWGSPPPIPEKSAKSREHEAGFLSKLTFQWMSPLMHVSQNIPMFRFGRRS
jgi:ATP-binding cassette subfamily C (CFTR/MRP) protein 1